MTTYLTNQEIFDRVSKHLLTQNAVSTHFPSRRSSRCAYLASDGKKCAVGCLIPKTEYTPEMEGCSVKALFELFPDKMKACKLSEGSFGLLVTLQRVHDGCIVHEWKKELQMVAEDYHLTFKESHQCSCCNHTGASGHAPSSKG